MTQKTIKISIPENYYSSLINDAIVGVPSEICGIVFGEDDNVSGYFPIRNISLNNTRFRFDPQDHINALQEMDKLGYKEIGIYHSHPKGPPHPSQSDLKENVSENQIHLIISHHHNKWVIRVFLLDGMKYEEIEIRIESSE